MSELVYPLPASASLPSLSESQLIIHSVSLVKGNDVPVIPAVQNFAPEPAEKELHDAVAKAGMCVAFRDVCFSVRVKDAETKSMVERKILKECSGIIRPGTLNAIMGASGGGKTSLLDVLADRKDPTTVSGTVLVNGKPRIRKTFMHQAGYVVQVIVQVKTKYKLNPCFTLTLLCSHVG
jgi:ABC-type glutathione transport system ATPase component